MAMGKFFFLRSFLNGLVLEVQDSNGQPGARLTTGHQKLSGNESQLFYEDPVTGTIRSKLNSYCMDVSEDVVVLTPFQPGNSAQQWTVVDRKIQSRSDTNLCVDIAHFDQEPGAKITAWKFHGKANQLWSVEYTSPRFFYLRSQMHGKVMDIRGSDAAPGGKVIAYDQLDVLSDNQLWYEDHRGIIRSKLNNYALDSSDGSMRMRPYDAHNVSMQWIYMVNRVVNRHDLNMVLDIKGASISNCAKLIPYEYNGGENQQWNRDYVD